MFKYFCLSFNCILLNNTVEFFSKGGFAGRHVHILPKKRREQVSVSKSYLVDLLSCLKHKVIMNEPLDPLQTTFAKNRQIRTQVGEAKDRSGFGPVGMFKLTGAYCG